MGGRRSIVVVGAGLAGLAAARRLADMDLTVTVLEGDPRAGGRAAGLTWDGVELDPAAHRIASTDFRLLELVRAAGLADVMLPLRPMLRAQAHRGRLVPIDPTELFGIARVPGVRVLEALRLARLPRLMRRFRDSLDPELPERAADLDDRSLADFGELYFGRSVVECWMEPTLAEVAPDDERETSRVAFLLRHLREHWATTGVFRAPLGRLPAVLAARLHVQLGTVAQRVEALPGGGLVVHARGPEGTLRLPADAAVLAIPADEALRVAEPLLTRAERDILGGVVYAAAIAWMLATRRPLVRHGTRARVPRKEGGALAALVLQGVGAGPEEPATSVLLAREPWSRERLEAPDDTIAKELGAELAQLVPGACDAVIRSRVHRVPRAYPRFPVGRYRDLARFRAVQQDRRQAGRPLYFAGDYLVEASLEGAVASGLRAAADAVSDLPAGGRT